ncbi:FkbM family methyltransferase [Helicobacter pullorum]|uniref:FkbM family methyltransferase n=1 Tax=Helicobacter pullorum TaxID=35818 RepID=UPI00320858F1
MENLEQLLKEMNKQIELSNQLNYQILMSNIIVNSKINEEDKQTLLLLLQDRDRNYIRINHNEECYQNISKYLDLLRPLELPLEQLVRIGGKKDGGYVMYGGGGHLENVDSKALSLGVSEYSPWDLEMAEKGFKVIEYDASIDKCPYKHPNISFHKKFIGTSNNENTITLQKAIEDNHLDKNKANILQCDIENCEWEMLLGIETNLLRDYFTQIIFEFHGCNPEEQEGVDLRTKLLEKINESFVPIHTHLNNHGKIFYSRGLFFSTTIEVSYLRKDLVESSIISNYRKEGGNLKGLDYPVWQSNPEIPIRFKKNE